MKMPFALVASLALTGFASLAPAAAVTNVAPAAQSLTFDTALTPQYYGAGEYDGVLHLSISPGGIVNGWYRDDDVGTIHTITGGLDGDKLWLDLGRGSLVDIQGTLDDGKIVASAYLGNQLYTFTGTPTKR